MRQILFLLLIQLFCSAALAGVCKIITRRAACAGKETEMLKPYDGQNPTEEKKELVSLSLCLSYADKSSKIIRRGVLRHKHVEVFYLDSKLPQTFSDTSTCH